MADRCPVCNGWMNTTQGGVHNCPGKSKAVFEPKLDSAEIEDDVPQLVCYLDLESTLWKASFVSRRVFGEANEFDIV
ncbi:hypothetical protein MGN70_004554 [Eutypa lata]|nr:hypothetical protein MGN70_004554 [Eutypa lata]